MAQLAQPITTYSDTTLAKRMITDVISIIDPKDTPMIEQLGGLDGASGKFNFTNRGATLAEWAEDTLFAMASTITETIESNTTTLTVADAYIFQEGDIIMIGTEFIWVSAVASSTTLTVTRALGSTAASAADNAVVTLVGQARLDGSDSHDRGFTDKTTNSNYSQIFHGQVMVARSANQVPQYGLTSDFDYQVEKTVPSLLRLIERNIFHGTRNAGSATTPRTSGGLPIFITDNTVNCTPTAPTQANIEDALQMAWEDGGTGPWVMHVSGDIMQAVKNLYDTSAMPYLQVTRQEDTLGMVVTKFHTPFGDVDLTLNRWVPVTKIYLVDPKHAGLLTYYPFTWEPLAKTGDADKSEVVGEFLFALRQDKAHAVLT